MPPEATSSSEFEFEKFLRILCGAAQHATITSLKLARDGHDLFDILDAVRDYADRPRLGRAFEVEIVFAAPDAKEFGLSIRRV